MKYAAIANRKVKFLIEHNGGTEIYRDDKMVKVDFVNYVATIDLHGRCTWTDKRKV